MIQDICIKNICDDCIHYMTDYHDDDDGFFYTEFPYCNLEVVEYGEKMPVECSSYSGAP